ncbi:uncharacterized protein LOC107415650 [Ziziphus jujuba]|uniref:Uncharacterized protein LOC107415650 n=1 Tax=Ziziphus jujuba TaxID=326968 RepID=A0A6P3ZIH7_ZIZJJ|nr:uncharacterized protein LOC107415650 [Ziziphus jujuba]
MAKNIDHELYKNFKDMYEGLMKGDMEKVLKQYDKLPVPLPDYLTVFGDTLLHIAIFMDREDIAREILKRYVNDHLYDLIHQKNNLGNTVLHEVATTNMVTLARDLLDYAPKLLSSRNNFGETPLFKAAYNGQHDMFDILSLAVDLTDKDNLDQHLTSKDRTNILHLTILAEFFDLAFIIANKYPRLVDKRNDAGKIGLQLLSNNPSAFLSSRNYGLVKRLIFKYCVPTSIEHEKKRHKLDDLKHPYELNPFDDEDQDNNIHKPKVPKMPRTYTRCMSMVASVLTQINRSIWTFLRGWPTMERIYNEHRKHESAIILAKLLIKKDTTWEITRSDEEGGDISLGSEGKRSKGEMAKETKPPIFELLPSHPTALLTATSNGIVEIVKEILRVYPQAVEHVSDAGQNILHVAVKHRQLEIFNHIRKMELPMSRLVRRIDDNGYTILHHVGVMKFYRGGTLPGPALQLQEELHWFERVKHIVPPHYEKHRSHIKKELLSKKKETSNEDEGYIRDTAYELFGRTHKDLHKDAREWLKNTAKSCSTVAVLIATVAFAAAYTVPGGSDSKTGAPILLHDPFFLVFTVMDVLSLATSLTSVVMFLSILTSPLELEDFKESLPRKLTFGFTFLFISVAMTMLAFAATIVLIVHLKKRWVTTLVYCLAFLPVTVFALLQYPLYLAFMDTMTYSLNVIKLSLPPLPWSSKKSVYKLD